MIMILWLFLGKKSVLSLWFGPSHHSCSALTAWPFSLQNKCSFIPLAHFSFYSIRCCQGKALCSSVMLLCMNLQMPPENFNFLERNVRYKKIQTVSLLFTFIKSKHTSYFLIFYCLFDEPFCILLGFLSIRWESCEKMCVLACYALKITWISRGKGIRLPVLHQITYDDPIILMTSFLQTRPF